MRLTPFAKFFILLVIAGVVGFVAWKRYGMQQHDGGSEQSGGTPSAEGDKGIFGRLAAPQDTGHDTSNVTGGSAGSGKLNRPLIVAINTWARHAPGLVANGGVGQARAAVYAQQCAVVRIQ